MNLMKKNFLKILYKALIHKIFNPFFAMNIKPLPLEIRATDKCLVIAPHPDDESIGCGGVMSVYPDNFEALCLTHGNDFRADEFKNAMEVLNVKSEMLDFKDKHVIDEMLDIDIKEFDYIFVPYIFDQHKDHKATSVLLNRLLNKAEYKQDLKIAFYEVWAAMNMPNYYVDFSANLEKKRAAINCHKSQVEDKDYATKILALNEYRGMLKNYGWLETFTVLNVKEFQKIIKDLVL